MTTLNIFIEQDNDENDIDLVLVLKNTKKIFRLFLKDLSLIKNSCLNQQSFSTISFDIVLCDKEKIQSVNKEYRNKDSVTDIITFAIFADTEMKFVLDNEIYLGEMLVCSDVVEKQAQDNNHSFEKELYYIIAHGILHLLGYDHLTMNEYNFMVEKQNFALSKLDLKK